jgi:hypothetical protein
MARSHGQLLVTIWADPDWLALPMHAQWTYAMFVSQGDINHAGILSLTPKRWADYTADRNPDVIADALKVLEDAGFIVVDADTEQVLVRAFVRRDGVIKQPNTLKNACASMLLVRSRKIRAALLAELQRLDLARIAALRPSRTDHERPIDVVRATMAALDDPPDPPGDRLPVTPFDGYDSDGNGSDPITRTRGGEGEGVGVGEVSRLTSRSSAVGGVTPRAGARRRKGEAPGQLPILGSVPAPPPAPVLAEIPQRCERCSRLNLAPDDPGPDCRACGELRRTRQHRAAALASAADREQREARAAARARARDCPWCEGEIWRRESPHGPLLEPAVRCDHLPPPESSVPRGTIAL